jgi:hypothetical protein
MRIYNPDRWVILKFWNDTAVTPVTTYKVFAGWYGGFTNGDSWKLNSGITKIERDMKLIRFTGWTSSVYEVHEGGYGMGGYMSSVYQSFCKQMEEDTEGNKMTLLTEEEAMEFCRESRTIATD